MQPQNGYQQPYQPPTNQPSDPFAFLNEQPKRRSPLPNLLNGQSMKQRIIVVCGGIVILIILIAVFNWLLGLGGSVNVTPFYSIVGEQTEITNLVNIGIANTTNQSYLNFSYTTLASVTTDKIRLLKLLASNGIKLDSKNLILQPAANSQLNQAVKISNFESTYGLVMQQQLQLYLSDLSNGFNKSTSTAVKNYLKTDYKDTQLLIKMLNGSSD